MKKAVANIAKFLVCFICVYGEVQSASAQTKSDVASCPEPPSYIQIDYHFDWSAAEQKRLLGDFKLKCGLPNDVSWLVDRIALALKALGLSVKNSRLSLKTEFGQANVKLETDKDDGQPRSVLFPVKHFEFDDSILSYANITGIVREDETLVLRYALDDSRIRDPNSWVSVQWLRDGRQVKGAQKSRYKLTSADVGRQLAAFISVQNSHGIVYAQRTIALKKKVGRVISLPKILNLEIGGDAVVGELVTTSYAYEDRNNLDKEENSQFVWLRDDFVIKGASGAAYQIVPQDAGKRISVKVTPRNVRGEIGKTMTFTMKQTVEDELITLRPEILAGMEHKERDLPIFETIQLKAKGNHEFESGDLNSKKLNKKKLEGTHNIYVTPELSIHHNSVRKITEVIFHPKNPFTDKFSKNVKYQFLGEEISYKTARVILAQLNLELQNANYNSIEAYFPEQLVKNGVLRVQFRKVKNDGDRYNVKNKKEFSVFQLLLIGAGMVCCI